MTSVAKNCKSTVIPGLRYPERARRNRMALQGIQL